MGIAPAPWFHYGELLLICKNEDYVRKAHRHQDPQTHSLVPENFCLSGRLRVGWDGELSNNSQSSKMNIKRSGCLNYLWALRNTVVLLNPKAEVQGGAPWSLYIKQDTGFHQLSDLRPQPSGTRDRESHLGLLPNALLQRRAGNEVLVGGKGLSDLLSVAPKPHLFLSQKLQQKEIRAK